MEYVFWFVIIALITLKCIGMAKDDKYESQKQWARNLIAYNIARYNKDTKELRVNYRTRYFLKAMSTFELDNTYTKHEPVKTHVGAVTVGNVTTGGVYQTGGYNYVASRNGTSKYALYFGNMLILSIALDKELYESALNSNISRYINKSKKCIEVYKSKVSFSESEQKKIELERAVGGNAANYLSKSLLSKGEIELIINWLSIEIPGQAITIKKRIYSDSDMEYIEGQIRAEEREKERIKEEKTRRECAAKEAKEARKARVASKLSEQIIEKLEPNLPYSPVAIKEKLQISESISQINEALLLLVKENKITKVKINGLTHYKKN